MSVEHLVSPESSVYYEVDFWQESDLEEIYSELELKNWAPWLVDDIDTLRERMQVFPEGQFVMRDNGHIVGVLSTNRVHWQDAPNPDTLPPSWDYIAGLVPNKTFADVHDPNGNSIAILVTNIHESYRGKGLSVNFLDLTRHLAKTQNAKYIIGPFRPSHYGENRSSVGSFSEYCKLLREDGQRLDPWLRNVQRNGAVFMGVTEESMKVEMPLPDFQQLKLLYKPDLWTETSSNVWDSGETGLWVVSGDVATYTEPNLWGAISPETAPPQFPQFHELTVADKPWYERRIQELDYHYCDFQFFGMFIWDKKPPQVSELNGNLVVTRFDNESGEPYTAFIGTNEIVKTTQELLQYLSEQNQNPQLTLVPEEVIEAGGEELAQRFQISPQRDYFDYVYSTKTISELNGSAFSNHRNKIKRFEKDNPNARFVELDLSSGDTQVDIISLCRMWIENKSSSVQESEYMAELGSIQNLLAHRHLQQVFAFGIYIDDRLVGFSAGGAVNTELIMSNFRKADTSYVGVYQYLEQRTAQSLYAKGYEYINREYDLGLKGLRKNKLSWQPSDLLEKFAIAEKNNV